MVISTSCGIAKVMPVFCGSMTARKATAEDGARQQVAEIAPK
jgi:hypothetical protein